MPPQKNAGAKASKRVSGVQSKNSRFIQSYLDDLRSEGKVRDVYVSRVIARLGVGRMEVFYIDSANKPQTAQAVIRGSFRGKGKRSVWIDIGSIVVIADSGIGGSAQFEIMAVLAQDDIDTLRRETVLDPRILDITNVDKDVLKTDRLSLDGGFEFDKGDAIEEVEEEIDIDDI
jgi:hypothetical protein